MPVARMQEPADAAARRSSRGQSLAEFAMAVPVFFGLLMGLIEFSFAYNAVLTVQYAARQGVSTAAQAGSFDGADCAILEAVDDAIASPLDDARISYVEIYLSDSDGDPVPGSVNRYLRVGNMDCSGTATPYTLSGSEGYPQTDRNETLAEGLDVVGVRVGYDYHAFTPVGAGAIWSLSDGATLRMEPKQ